MRKSTKHAIGQLLLGLAGIALFAGPMWLHKFDCIPPTLQLTGLLFLFFAILSAIGVGSWGRYYSALVVSDNEAHLKSLEVKQPWQQ